MCFDIGSFARLFQHVANFGADRMRESDMRDDAFAEECRLLCSRTGAIKELVRYDHVERRVLLLQRPDCRSGQDALDAKQLHAVDVRAKRHFSRRESMATSMTRQ